MNWQRYLLVFSLILHCSGSWVSTPVKDSIQTSSDFSTEQLVREVFLKSKCKNVSNIRRIGNERSVGYFSGGANILGLSEGIILSTGDISLAAGPNESAETTQAFGENPGDPDIDRLADGPVFDAAGIEFDFVPLNDRVSFRYIFASEEYCEFVDSRFNDLFGFFVSGPGIEGAFADGAINVALVPGSEEFVAINSVNHRRNTEYYIKNELEEDARRCEILFNPAFPNEIEYDGFTIPLTATFDVIPCETYRIRLVVADVSDEKLDSAVFLESKSFDIGDPVTVQAKVEGSNEPIAVETCRNGSFVFERGNLSALGDSIIVNYSIDGSSTADEGEDFTPIPGSITIPGGQKTAVLPIDIIDDGLEEGTESILLELDYPCECIDSDSSALLISDLTAPIAADLTTTACPGQIFTLRPEISGGAPPYDIQWEDGSTGPEFSGTVDEPAAYAFTVTDACGSQNSFEAEVLIQPPPTATLSETTTTFCPGAESFLEVQLEGNPPWSLTYLIDGSETVTVSQIMTTPYLLPVTQTGIYQLSSFSDGSCSGTTAGQVTVLSSGLELSLDKQDPSCINTEDGSIQVAVIGGTPPYTYEWGQQVNEPAGPSGLPPGFYSVSVTDSRGCQTSGQITLRPRIQRAADCADLLYAPTAFSPNGDGINDRFQLFTGPNNFIGRIRLLRIFDRWGNLVFKRENFLLETGLPLWDGRFRGRPLSSGLFVWWAEVLFDDGSTKTISGEVMLLR